MKTRALTLPHLLELNFRIENQNFINGSVAEELLTTCAFSHCQFTNTDWSASMLQNAQFLSCLLRAQNFSKFTASGVHWTFAQLQEVNFEAAEFVGSHWSDCKLYQVSFKNAKFTNCSFPQSQLINCDFRGADLRGLDLTKVTSLGGCLFDHRTQFGSNKVELMGKGLMLRNLELTATHPRPLAPVIEIQPYLRKPKTSAPSAGTGEVIVVDFTKPTDPLIA